MPDSILTSIRSRVESPATLLRMSTPNLPTVAPGAGAMALPSGRTLNVAAGPDGEHIEIRAASGQLEVRISLTPDGPVLSLSGAKLEINASDTIAVNCKDLSINTAGSFNVVSSGTVGVRAQGDMKMKAMGNTDIDAQLINLNGGDRSEYNDAALPVFEVLTPPAPLPPPAAGDDCGCGHAH